MDVEPGHRYWNAHVDKANRASYDYSALLYLNSHCSAGDGGCDYGDTEQPDFEGGLFSWLDEEADLTVQPRGGRLLTFSGGLENPHSLTKVARGTRYVIGMWFTCHEELMYVDEEEEKAAAAEEPPPVPPRRRRARTSEVGRAEEPPPVPPRRRGARRQAAAAAAAAATEREAEGAPQVPRRRRGASSKERGDASMAAGADYSYGLSDDASLDEALVAYRGALERCTILTPRWLSRERPPRQQFHPDGRALARACPLPAKPLLSRHRPFPSAALHASRLAVPRAPRAAAHPTFVRPRLCSQVRCGARPASRECGRRTSARGRGGPARPSDGRERWDRGRRFDGRRRGSRGAGADERTSDGRGAFGTRAG